LPPSLARRASVNGNRVRYNIPGRKTTPRFWGHAGRGFLVAGTAEEKLGLRRAADVSCRDDTPPASPPGAEPPGVGPRTVRPGVHAGHRDQQHCVYQPAPALGPGPDRTRHDGRGAASLHTARGRDAAFAGRYARPVSTRRHQLEHPLARRRRRVGVRRRMALQVPDAEGERLLLQPVRQSPRRRLADQGSHRLAGLARAG